jgi:hypothetical protein
VTEPQRSELLPFRGSKRGDFEYGDEARYCMRDIRAKGWSAATLTHPAAAVVKFRARLQQRSQELWILELQRSHQLRMRDTGVEQRGGAALDGGAERTEPIVPTGFGHQPCANSDDAGRQKLADRHADFAKYRAAHGTTPDQLRPDIRRAVFSGE